MQEGLEVKVCKRHRPTIIHHFSKKGSNGRLLINTCKLLDHLQFFSLKAIHSNGIIEFPYVYWPLEVIGRRRQTDLIA